MDSRDPIRDFFTFLLGAVLLSMGAFLFFNQVMVSSEPVGRSFRFGHGFGRTWGGGHGLLLIPLVIGVCLLFALRNQRWGWFLVLASVAALAVETRQGLLAAGWQEADQGVFTRRCQDNCRRPVLYGGGVVDVMEVNCLERPCGDIRAQFAVVGERLQLVLESRLPESRRFVLQSFSAKARLD